MHECEECALLLHCEQFLGGDKVSPGTLDPPHLGESARVAYRYRVGRPSGREVHPRTNLEYLAVQERRVPKPVGLECLCKQPGERVALPRCELAGHGDVVAVLAVDVPNT